MSRIGRNLMWLVLSQASSWAISIIMLVAIPRLVADADFGRVEFAFTFVSFFSLLALFGTGTFLTKTTAREPALLGPYVFNALVLKLVVVPLLAAAAIGIAALWGLGSKTVLLVAICSVTMIASSANDVVVAGLHGRQRMKGAAAWAAIQQYVSALGSLVVLLLTDDIVLYTLALVSAGFIPMVANIHRLWPELRGHLSIDRRVWVLLLRGGAPFLIWNAVQLVYGRIDILMIRQMVGEAPVGWYSLAWQWVSLPVFFATLVSTAFFPSLSAHGGAARTEIFSRMGNQALRLIVFVGVPSAAGIALVAHDVFRLLGYSGGYLNAVPLMQVLAISIPIVGMDVMLGNMLVAVDKQRQWVQIGIAACFVNVGLNIPGIRLTERWYGNGAIGAAAATVITELLMMVGAIALRPVGVLDRRTLTFMVRVLAATAAMALAVLVAHDLWVGARAVLGLGVYGAASLGVRTLSLRTWRRDFFPTRDADEDDGSEAGTLAGAPA